jgi:hypothetical protein
LTPQEVLEEFRTQVDDEAPPYLWSDDSAFRYLVDAQDLFCRLTGGISDRQTAAICQVAVTASQPYAAFSPYVLRIRSIWLNTAKRAATIVSEGDLPNLPVRDYGTTFGWGRGLFLDDTDVGEVDWAILGIQENKIRWLRVPNASDTALMHVYRLPYPRLTSVEDANCPPLEIGEHHHLHLVKWMKHLAYSKEDAETYDKKLAADNEALFRAYCTDAKKEIVRQRHKTRIVKVESIWQ